MSTARMMPLGHLTFDGDVVVQLQPVPRVWFGALLGFMPIA